METICCVRSCITQFPFDFFGSRMNGNSKRVSARYFYTSFDFFGSRMNGNKPNPNIAERRATFDFFGSRMNGNSSHPCSHTPQQNLLISSEVA